MKYIIRSYASGRVMHDRHIAQEVPIFSLQLCEVLFQILLLEDIWLNIEVQDSLIEHEKYCRAHSKRELVDSLVVWMLEIGFMIFGESFHLTQLTKNNRSPTIFFTMSKTQFKLLKIHIQLQQHICIWVMTGRIDLFVSTHF